MRKHIYDVFFVDGLATEVVQTLVPSLQKSGSGDVDVNAVHSNTERYGLRTKARLLYSILWFYRIPSKNRWWLIFNLVTFCTITTGYSYFACLKIMGCSIWLENLVSLSSLKII